MSADESETVENKLSLSERKEIAESVAAFATASGGFVRVGIDNGGAVVGVQIGARTIEDYIRDNTSPPQFPSISCAGPDDSTVISVHVEESPVKPVWASGRPLKRVGRTNQRLSPDETRRLMELTTGRTWDALPCPGLTLSNVDRQLIESFLRRAEQDPTTSTESVLRNLNLLSGDAPGKADRALGNRHAAHCPSLRITRNAEAGVRIGDGVVHSSLRRAGDHVGAD